MPVARRPSRSRPPRRSTLLLCAAVFAWMTPVAHAEKSPIEHQRVLWMHNPAEEAVISWTTRTAGTTHEVYYDTVPRHGDLSAYARQQASFKDGSFTMNAEDAKWVQPAYFHHVHLSGLQPATLHYFTIVSDGQASPEYHFLTAPADDRPFAILAGGDSRIEGDTPYEHNDRRKMNERMAALLQANPSILALAHGGDYCQRAEWRYLDGWLSDHELTATPSGRLLPVIPTRGNHDTQVGFVETFSWPGAPSTYYYTTRLSAEAALVVLNTEVSLSGDQRTWLAAELETLRPENRWIAAIYHKPAFPSVRAIQDGASRRDNWVPLFEQFNVDLVYESHDHALKRTLPIRGGQPDHRNGITYIGDGGLGVPQRKPDPTRWWFEKPGFTRAAHHVHMLEFDRQHLRVRAFGMEGEALDDFHIEPRTPR
jgi:acid phosphatase type 7